MTDPQTDSQLDRLNKAAVVIRRLKERIATFEQESSEPIAIVGMGCRFPGGAEGPEKYWELLESARDAVVPMGPRWEALGVTPPPPSVPRWAGLLDGPVDTFDAGFFGISPREAPSIDPQQRLLLEVSWEALEHAGLPPHALAGSRTGVFIGACSLDYLHEVIFKQPHEQREPHGTAGNTMSVVAGRVSYTLGLHGPSLIVDTACSSSLVAVHLARRSLLSRESDVVLAGGVNLILSVETTLGLDRMQALSADGRCRTFDALANGMVRGEGCGVVVLKRLSDARRDGDRIWGLIRGSAINQDGRSNGLTAPNAPAQELLLREAHRSAGVDASAIDYIETHGTGTPLGDPIEIEALRAVMGGPRADGTKCVLGAVKTNLGHLEASAGVAGIIKAVLAMHHHRIPANRNFRTLNPRIRLDGTPLVIPSEPVEWPRNGHARLAGVSAFGLSGTNAHLVLEEPPPAAGVEPAPARSAELVVLSARTVEALGASAGRLRAHLDANSEVALGDLAYSLASTRSPMEVRMAVAVPSREALREALERVEQAGQLDGTSTGLARSDVANPKVAFVFPGHGSQWLGMGRQLLEEEPAFRAAMETCDAAIVAEAGWSVLAELRASPQQSRLQQVDVVQPVLFAMGVSLAALWRSWGIEPQAVVGHSLGEVAAACVSGALGVRDAAAVVCRRAGLLRQIVGRGEMALVELSLPEAEKALAAYGDRLSVAVSNSRKTTVVSGAPDAMAQLFGDLERRGVFCRRVKVDYASHSGQVDPILDELVRALDGLSPGPVAIPMHSTLTGTVLEGREMAGQYWADNLRRPVRFAEAIQRLLADGFRFFVEMSPHPLLVPAVEELRQEAEVDGVSTGSLRREQPERLTLLESLGALHVHGQPLEVARLFPSGGRRVGLPTYPWQRERFWIERGGRAKGARAHGGGHPLLGPVQEVSTQAATRLWETSLDLDRLPWLADHKVQGAVVFPGAGYMEMALAAGAEMLGEAVELRDVHLADALVLTPDAPAQVQLVATDRGADRRDFQVSSRPSGPQQAPWRGHARGTVRRAATSDVPNLDLDALRARLRPGDAPAAVVAAYGRVGIDYGPAFQGLAELWLGQGEALGRLRATEAAGSRSAYRFHPAWLDACLQVMGALFSGASETAAYVPVELASLQLVKPPSGDELFCYATEVDASDDHRRADLRVADPTGATVAVIGGLVAKKLARSETPADDPFLEIAWEAAAVGEPKLQDGRWLLVGDAGGLGHELAAALEGRGQRVSRLSGEASTPQAVRAGLAAAFGGEAPTAVVHLGSLDGPGGLDVDAAKAALAFGYDGILAAVQAVAATQYRDPPRLWVVTRGAQPGGDADGVAQSPALGLCRVVALEHPELRCARLDLAPGRPAGELESIVAELLADGPEDEVALRREGRLVARLRHREEPSHEQREEAHPASGRAYRLETDQPGVLERLGLRAVEARPPKPGEVQIAIEAAGLNFLDVMKAMGIYPGLGDGPVPLGSECAGRVTAVGEGVERFRVGDDVVAMGAFCMASHLTINELFVAPRPASLTVAEGATTPGVFMTAWYGLVHLARLRAGERVLIHSAAGGTGLAAVRVARHLGAEVFATAGTEAKREWLRSLGITHVMDSRTLDFAEQVMAATGGKGVDVVLNSLSGEAIDASLSTLGEDGRFIELGKTDIYADRLLTLGHFRKSLTFSAVDLGGFGVRKPELFAALFQEVMDLFARGVFSPLPVESFPISRAADAFHKMAQARHTGKLALTMDDPEAVVKVPTVAGARVRSDGSYLVTGGLGGLGLSVAGWLAEKGAGHLVLIGRSGAQSEAQRAAVASLEARGARVTVVKADASDREGLARAVEAAEAAGTPLRGVIHAAGVLDDGLLAQQTPERARAVMAPKILGALHLHELTRSKPLDFFVAYSSAAGLFGSPGQGNYAAANTFLDALAHHRRAVGLPALSLDWGGFSEVGLAAAQEIRGERLVSRGMRYLSPGEGLRHLERLLDEGDVQVGVVPVDVRQWVEFYPAAASSLRLSRLAEEPKAGARPSGDRELLDRLAAAETKERVELVQSTLRGHVAKVLRIAAERVDPHAPLTSLGMDSLMGLELRNRIEGSLGIKVSSTILWTYPTLNGVVRHLVDSLFGQPAEIAAEVAAAPASPEPAAAPPVDAATLSKLTDDDLLRLAAAEL